MQQDCCVFSVLTFKLFCSLFFFFFFLLTKNTEPTAKRWICLSIKSNLIFLESLFIASIFNDGNENSRHCDDEKKLTISMHSIMSCVNGDAVKMITHKVMKWEYKERIQIDVKEDTWKQRTRIDGNVSVLGWSLQCCRQKLAYLSGRAKEVK